MPKSAFEPIAIVGVSTLFPDAKGSASFWQNILQGHDAIKPVAAEHWLTSDYYDADPKAEDKTYCQKGGFIPPVKFDPMAFGIPPNTLNNIDSSQVLALIVAKQVLNDAYHGQFSDDIDRSKMSVVLGVASATELLHDLVSRLQKPIWVKAMREEGLAESQVDKISQRIADSYVPWGENAFPGLLSNVISGRIANRLDLHGSNCVVDAACASTLSAVQIAVNELHSGHSNLVIAGGVDTLNDILMYMCFSKTPAFSKTGDCRPFSAAADGTIIGEGLGMFALKRLEDAERDGNPIYAVLKGLGASSDGKSTSVYAPRPEGQALAIERAYQYAGYDTHTVDLVEAHGTGTLAGDKAELAGLMAAFKPERKNPCALGSIKSQIGHTKAAAGSAGLFKIIMAVQQGVLPATLKIDQPNSALTEQSSFYLNTQLKPWFRPKNHPRRASVSAFGFGGSNFHATIEEYEGHNKAKPFRALPSELVLISAQTTENLTATLLQFQQCQNTQDYLHNIKQAQQQFNAKHPCRMAWVSLSLEDCLNTTKQLLATGHPYSIDGINYRNSTDQPGKMATIFSGQGSQYIDMGLDLACYFTESKSVWQDENITDEVRQKTFPATTWPSNPVKNTEALTQTHIAQPAIAAMSLSLKRLLDKMGWQPDATLGHSFGEILALHQAGSITETQALQLANLRGQAMLNTVDHPSGMLALQTDTPTAKQLLTDCATSHTILANMNSPSQVILSGPLTEIDIIIQHCKSHKIKQTKLNVAAAFHSKEMQPCADEFLKNISTIDFKKPIIPISSNVTAQSYPDNPSEIAELLANQIASPVQFQIQVERLLQQGYTTFVEVGPDKKLCKLIQQCADNRAITVLSFNDKQQDLTAFWKGIGDLCVQGYPLDPSVLWENFRIDQSLDANGEHCVDISGHNHGKPYPPKEGQAGIPQPNPETIAAPPRPVEPTPAAHPAINQLLTLQSQTLVAHQSFQDTMADSHKAFLATAQTVLQQLSSDHGNTNSAPEPTFNRTEIVANTSAPSSQTLPTPPQVTPAIAAQPEEEPASNLPTSKPIETPSLPEKNNNNNNTLSSWIALVAEKTGYPKSSIHPDMALEQDLGIDSIKRVEILSSAQESGLAPDNIDANTLSSLETIQAIYDACYQTAPPLPQSTLKIESTKTAISISDTSTLQRWIELVADKTGYPAASIHPEMALEQDLGIDSIKRVEILSSAQEQGLAPEHIDANTLSNLDTIQAIFDACYQGESNNTVIVDTPTTPVKSSSNTPATLQQWVQLVADKTGYPATSILPDMALEQDLGVDSIKRVEILSAAQEQGLAPEHIDANALSNLETIQAIFDACYGNTQTPQAHTEHTPTLDIKHILLSIVADKTGYPVDLLDLTLPLESGLGIDSIKRVEILSACQDALPNELDPQAFSQCNTLEGILNQFANHTDKPEASNTIENAPQSPDTDSKSITLQLHELIFVNTPCVSIGEPSTKSTPIAVLPNTDISQNIARHLTQQGYKAYSCDETSHTQEHIICTHALAECQTPEQAELIQYQIFSVAQQFAKQQPKQLKFITLQDSDLSPWLSGLPGFCKTANKEWPDSRVFCIDIKQANHTPGQISDIIESELSDTSSHLSIRYLETLMREVESLSAIVPHCQKPVLLPLSTVIVTGGARGITAACLKRMIHKLPVKLVLLGSTKTCKTPKTCENITDIVTLTQALSTLPEFSALKPIELKQKAKNILASQEIKATLSYLEKQHIHAAYYTCDVTNRVELNACLEAVRKRFGAIYGLIHAAGTLEDKRIEDKSMEQFKRVYRTKVTGFANLIAATKTDPINTVIAFSSIAAASGNPGQSDYAAANQVLNHYCTHLKAAKPNAIIKAYNWGAWDGGMVTPALKQHFEQNNVCLIPIKQGTILFREMLIKPCQATQVIVTPVSPDNNHNDLLSLPDTHPQHSFSLTTEELQLIQNHQINNEAIVPMTMAAGWIYTLAKQLNAITGLSQIKLLHGIQNPSPQTTLNLKCQQDQWQLFSADQLHYQALQLITPMAQTPITLNSNTPWHINVQHRPEQHS